MTTWTFPKIFRNWPDLSDVAFRYLVEIYQELDRVPRVVTINLTHLGLRLGKSDKSSKRALENIAACGLCERVDSKTGAAGGVAYRFVDWRLAAADPTVKFPDVNQLRLSFIELIEEEGDRPTLGIVSCDGPPSQQELPEFASNHSPGCGDTSGGMPTPAANHSPGCGDASGGMDSTPEETFEERKERMQQELAFLVKRESGESTNDRHAGCEDVNVSDTSKDTSWNNSSLSEEESHLAAAAAQAVEPLLGKPPKSKAVFDYARQLQNRLWAGGDNKMQLAPCKKAAVAIAFGLLPRSEIDRMLTFGFENGRADRRSPGKPFLGALMGKFKELGIPWDYKALVAYGDAKRQ